MIERTDSHDGRVAWLRLASAALTTRDIVSIGEVADSLTEDRNVRVVVLSGGPDSFCEGVASDVNRLRVGVDPAAALSRIRVPIVAQISGTCASAGLELALACDVRIASEDAKFSLPELYAGMFPCWGGTQRLPRAVGQSWAVRLLLLGDTMDAIQAETTGFVYRIGGDDVTAATVETLLTVGPLAAEFAKEAVHRGAEMPLRDGLRLEGDLNTLLQASADRIAGLDAFFAKRLPDFAGR